MEKEKKYRVSIDLVQTYETYVYAKDDADAQRKGMEVLEDGGGNFVEDHYQEDSLKVETLHPYKATQKVVLTYVHHMDAANDEEARMYAERQFDEDHNLTSLAESVDVGDITLARE